MQNSNEISYVTREQVTQVHGMKLITDFNNEDFECIFCKFALREQSHLVNIPLL